MNARELRSRADKVMIEDRRRLQKRIRGAERIGMPSKRHAALAAIERDLSRAEARIARRTAVRPGVISYPEDLPITARHDELVATIGEHQVVIVAGETGSGKSTQLPKMCLELGRGVEGLIAHTQPRRIAARAIAERVAEELGGEVGGVVGYAVRFTDRVGDDTLVKVMTDGLLLAEIQRDPTLSAYDTVIVDEAHERSLNIDFLLGYLKRLTARRPELKVVVTSATIDTVRFSAHFDDAPVVEVSGRAHPVEIRYRVPEDEDGLPKDQTEAICDAVLELAAESTGDILVFCSGEREIRDAAEALGELRLPHTEVLPLYARLSSAEQHRVFAPHTGRRIVLATNVAETSLTVPGIRSVVDVGTARISRYSRRTKVQRLPIEPISRASADQRAGRCGRLGPGICIRLYTEDDLAARPEFTEPEIQRTNLAAVILQMTAAGLGDIESFPFLDPPDSRSIRDGVALLEELDALEWHASKPRVTATGRLLARLPVDPRLGRMLVESDRRGCLTEVLVIVSALSIIDPRERTSGQEAEADRAHARFEVAGSDLLAWLRLWDHIRKERRALTSNQFRRMCKEEYLNHRRIREWQDVHGQLRQLCAELGLRPAGGEAEPDVIHKSLLAGLLSHVGRKDPSGHEYRGARNARFSIAPGSVLFRRSPEWVMAADLVETTRLWARGAAVVAPEWAEEVGGHVVNRSHSEPWWDATRGAAMAHETVTLFGIPLFDDRVVQFGRIDPGAARHLFIRHALVLGEWQASHAFLRRNAERVAEVEAQEARYRRDLLVDDDTIHRFFDVRVPADVTSSRHFDAWWRKTVGSDPHRLELTTADLTVTGIDASDAEAFPEEWHHGDLVMPIRYEFEPGSELDGVIVDVPAAGLDRLDPSVFEWHVPGHRQELVGALIRSLPKELRKRFLPIQETAAHVLEVPSTGGLINHLRRELSRLSGVSILADDFDMDRLPGHLKPTFRVVAPDGGILAVGDDLGELRRSLRDQVRSAVSDEPHPLERSGLTRWDFGVLPKSVEVPGPVNAVTAYPALVDEGASVAVRLLAGEAEQAEAMWFGTRRLMVLAFDSASRLLKALLDSQARADLGLGPYRSTEEWVADCLECAADAVLEEAGGPAWDAVGFDALMRRMRDNGAGRLAEVGEGSIKVMAALRDLQIVVDRREGPRFEAVIDDIRSQVGRLIYPGFLGAIGRRRVGDVERYLRAMEWRLERLPENPERDRQRMEAVWVLEGEYDRLMDSIPITSDLIAIGWLLQELRVSYFAQPLGTRDTVSAKRVAAALREAELAI